jgi:hypothetical protein
MWAGLNSATPGAATTALINCSFQNAAALTHKVFEIATWTPTAAQGTISSILLFKVTRAAASTQNLSGNNIFLLGVDAHIPQDTVGSRQEYIK